MTVTHPIRLVRGVTLDEWARVLAAAVVATGVEVGLRTMGLPRLARLLGVPLDSDGRTDDGTSGRSPLPPRTLPERERRNVRAVRRVLRHWPFGDTCLRQALVCGHRLRRRHPTLHLGVAKIDGEVRAHAWLVIDGAVLDPLASAASYSQLHAIPSKEPR